MTLSNVDGSMHIKDRWYMVKPRVVSLCSLSIVTGIHIEAELEQVKILLVLE